MIMTFGALVLATQLAIPVADKLPRLDYERVCRAAAQTDPTLGDQTAACRRDEEAARDQLAGGWSQYPATDRAHCTTMATMAGNASYIELLICLETARDVRNLPGRETTGAGQMRP
jgi:hypothetical protein